MLQLISKWTPAPIYLPP
ncbi:hypothetical protein Goshw_019186 [Gossypium schwendimanii]|uniref:Uncharacterized protein n=1 Tax=Gossypium schwendimanii TaxID=34291 RepID=A0A7J9LGV7_GOSSC|nr:hypothetical protein [Gossypium schwendimanii]